MTDSIAEPYDKQGVSPFAAEEVQALEQFETVIERGLKTFVEVGEALAAIRDRRLYRQTNSTFQDYCQDRWDFDRRRANQLISASKVSSNIEKTIGKNFSQILLPQVESQAAELAKLPEDRQAEAWEEVIHRAKKPTAATVAQVVGEMLAKEDVPNNEAAADTAPQNAQEAAKALLNTKSAILIT